MSATTERLMQEAKKLHQAGRLAEAVTAYQQILRSAPAHFEALYGLGMAHAQAGRLEEGECLVGEAVKFNPRFAEAWRARGLMLMHLGRRDEARECVDRALALNSDFKEALSVRAALRGENTGPQDALTELERAIAAHPEDAASWNTRGSLLASGGRKDEALASFDKALQIEPHFAEAAENRDLPLFELGRTSRSPPKYIRGLFDGFARHYDDTMLTKLNYRAHLHVRTMAERVLSHLQPPLHILDIGCGTGLVGVAFKDLAKGGRLDGIDIAPRMIEAARARGIYNELIVGDLEAVLAAPGASYDLIVSADTMTYFGDLSRAFSGVAKRLKRGGFYCFASEAKNGDGWEQTKVHRFRHGESYLRAQAERAGLELVHLTECTLRQEENEPVAGFAVALRTAPAA